MRWLRWLFLVYLGAVLSLTLWPSLDDSAVPGWAQSTIELLARLGIRTSVPVLEMASNVVMFVPFGLLGVPLLDDARRRWTLPAVVLTVTGAGFALSGLIELAQLVIPGRVTTVQDVALNGLGALIGAGLGAAVLAVSGRRTARHGRRPAADPAR